MGVKYSTAALAAVFATGISAAPAVAAPFFVEVSGTVVSADGNWAGSAGEAFTSQQTIDDDGGNATLIDIVNGQTWWIFQGGSYGFNYLSTMLGGSLPPGDTVWVETLDDFMPTATNNPFSPFGLTSTSPVDVVTISGGNVVADCTLTNVVDFCENDNAAPLDGIEFNISFIATSDWFTGDNVYPDVYSPNLLAIWGQGIEYTDGDVTASAIIEFSTVPLPAALPMFVAGLGVLGLFGFRRKRAAAA